MQYCSNQNYISRLSFPRLNEKKIPAELMRAKQINPHFTVFKNTGLGTASTVCPPNMPAKKSVATVMLVICPITRMVAAVPEASPNWFLFTELIIVFMLGDEKNANPSPTQTSIITMSQTGVVSERKEKAASPRVHMVIPIVVR